MYSIYRNKFLGIGISILEFCKMRFRKFKADQLFNGYQMFSDDQVLIVSASGTVEDIVHEKEAGDDIEYYPGTLSPGFINCHCHLELSHMKGRIPRKTGLTGFLLSVINNRQLPEEEILDKITEGDHEMYQAGIVAVGDICNNTLTIPQKLNSRIYYHNFIEVFGVLPPTAAQRFQQAIEIFNEYVKQDAIPQKSCSLVPHAPYSVSADLWEKIVGFPDNHLMTIHNQESDDENNLFMNGQGGFREFYEKMRMDISFFQPTQKSSFQSFLQKFRSPQPLIAVHNVCTKKDDIQYAKNLGKKIYWCFCPNANLYISGRLPDVDLFMTENCEIVLGTDSLASNDQLSVLTEMQTLHRHLPSLALEDSLKWATINGARALQMDGLLGSFEPGKKPGVLVIEPHLSGVRRLM
jgi:cytosine/adenosine deaminase-related metal-dependent hydrolase